MNKIVKSILLCSIFISLSSCGIYNKYELKGDTPITADYLKSLEAPVDSTSLPYLGWEQIFTDPQLQGYIRLALERNADLDNARLNIDMAQAQLKGAKLGYFPSVTLNPNGGSASYGGSHMNWSYTIPLAVNWEIDVFAKMLNRKRGAQVSVEQMEDYAQAVQSQIVCGVANSYYALVLLQQQLDLTQRTAEIWKDQVESMQLMKEAGMVNEAAVVQSRANYYNIQSTIPDLERSISSTNNALSILLNEYPASWMVNSDMDFNLPVEVSAGVPINYLAVRPDVRAAERAMASAYYTVNSAKAAFFPNLAISAQGGFTNLLGAIISNPGEWFIQLAGQLTAPIFSRGQNIANLEVAKAQQKQALNTFQKTVLSAAADVSDALVSINKYDQKRQFILKQIDELEKSVEYTAELLTLDRNTTYLELLTARSSLLNAQLSSLACWHNKVTSLISLYQAVGGGR